ncbi:MAG: 50S ribosomal protein L25/general stress protein Ctc [Devosiaceae bacterium]|nr:50S ribosomal protein L25/general stress protein Ctc [Devosiaceae bacterium]
MAQAELNAIARDRVGKGAARELRRNNQIPAVIYGDKQPPLSIAIAYKDAMKNIHAGGFLSSLLTIDVNGEKHKVIPRDYQLDPVKDKALHIDFLRIGKNTILTLEIPVHFLNEEESPGLKRGAVLNIVRHTVEINCPATAIPDAFEIDLTGTDVGDSLNISMIKLPEGASPTITDRDFTIATIAAPSALRSEGSDDDEDEVVEGEEGEEGETAEGEEGEESKD